MNTIRNYGTHLWTLPDILYQVTKVMGVSPNIPAPMAIARASDTIMSDDGHPQLGFPWWSQIMDIPEDPVHIPGPSPLFMELLVIYVRIIYS